MKYFWIIFLISCGDINIPEQDITLSEAQIISNDEEAEIEEEPETNIQNGDNNNITVSTEVELCSDQIKQEIAQRPQFYIQLTANNFYEALTDYPSGYRLPERWELVKAFDNGDLEIEQSGYFWTSDEYTDVNGYEYAWAFNVLSGKSEKYQKLVSLYTVYIKE